jgi:hypothetical protein
VFCGECAAFNTSGAPFAPHYVSRRGPREGELPRRGKRGWPGPCLHHGIGWSTSAPTVGAGGGELLRRSKRSWSGPHLAGPLLRLAPHLVGRAACAWFLSIGRRLNLVNACDSLRAAALRRLLAAWRLRALIRRPCFFARAKKHGEETRLREKGPAPFSLKNPFSSALNTISAMQGAQTLKLRSNHYRATPLR